VYVISYVAYIAIYENKNDHANYRVIVTQDTLMKTHFLIMAFYCSENIAVNRNQRCLNISYAMLNASRVKLHTQPRSFYRKSTIDLIRRDRLPLISRSLICVTDLSICAYRIACRFAQIVYTYPRLCACTITVWRNSPGRILVNILVKHTLSAILRIIYITYYARVRAIHGPVHTLCQILFARV